MPLRHLIGLKPNPQLDMVLQTFSDADVAKLVYRDNIKLKHGSRKRLGDELASKPPHPSLRPSRADAIAGANDPEPLSKALVAYLLEAHCLSYRPT